MTNIILHGCNGAMGRVISELAASYDDIKIVAGADINTETVFSYPVYPSISEVKEEADVIVDFASVKAVNGLLSYASSKAVPVVLCTTGLDEEQLEAVQKAAEHTAILRSANMSLGVNLLLKLVKEAAQALEGKGFDIEIVEKHHRRKLDAPSGTAIALADSVNSGLRGEYEYNFGRAGRHEKRPDNEIGISSVRGGNIVGDHDVIFAGEDELITISHTAYSRKIFASGALEAARYLAGRPAGMYTMNDVIEKGQAI